MNPKSKIRIIRAALIGTLLFVCGILAFSLPALLDGLVASKEKLITHWDNRPIPCEQMSIAEVSKSQPIKDIVSPNVGGMGKWEYQHGTMGKEHPHVAILAFDGWLFGSDLGEFGGALYYRDHPKADVFLAFTNIEDIFQMPFGFVATTARYPEMSYPGVGQILLVQQVQGKVQAKHLHNLPAAATSSWLLKSGELLVNTLEGSVILGKDKSLRRVTCKKSQNDA